MIAILGDNQSEDSMSSVPSPEAVPLSLSDVDDERLVRLISESDPDAERLFVQRFMRPVRGMLLALSHDPELTADLLQDVMIEAICALRRGQLRNPLKLRAFVAAIGRNALNKHYYRRSRRPVSVALPDDLPDLQSMGVAQEQEERGALAMEAIASLDKEDRTILEMTLVDGLKPGNIAKQMGLNPDVVRQRKVRAIRKVIDFVRQASQKSPSVPLVNGQMP
jgi:RNA polymerase sigma factor (sigma-70 family)